MSRKILWSAVAARPASPVLPALLLKVMPGDTEIIERTGKTVSVVGPITVDGSLQRINMPGTDTVDWIGRYIKITGASGDFDFLFDGSSPWTVEMLCQFIGEPTYDSCLFASTIPEIGEATMVSAEGVYEGRKMGKVEIRGFDSGYIIDLSVDEPTSAWPIDAPGHLAVTFDPALTTNACAFFLKGERVAVADKSAVAPYTETGAGDLYIGGNEWSWPSMKGYIYGVRVSKSVLYSGATYTPPTSF